MDQTETNKPLLKLVNLVKSEIDALRQDFREGVPEELARRFKKRRLTREEWSRLHKGIGQTDILALGRPKALELLKDPSKVTQEIRDAEEVLKGLSRSRSNRYKAKARALAQWMVRKEVTSENLLRNAHAIAHLYGEKGAPNPNQVTEELITAIDKLTTLYAWEALDDQTRQTASELMESEPDGMNALVGFHRTTRLSELQRRDRTGVNKTARNNGWKGYVPALTREGSSVIVADDKEHDALVRRGYVRIGDYQGDGAEGYAGRRGYYQSSVGGKGAFRLGSWVLGWLRVGRGSAGLRFSTSSQLRTRQIYLWIQPTSCTCCR